MVSGTYSGFSIGGRYARKWAEPINGKIVQRYTAMPSEISLVDRPCIAEAKFFQVHKRDGRVVKRAFANTQEGNSMQMSDEMAKYLKLDHSRNAIRKIHAAGARPLPPNFIHKFTGWAGKSDRATVEIRKSQGRPLALHPSANVQVDTHQLAKMLKRGRRMRKVGFPPQSSNGQWGGGIASTGATNDFHDEGDNYPKPTHIAGQVIGVPSQTNMQAAVDAIKADWARGAKRMG